MAYMPVVVISQTTTSYILSEFFSFFSVSCWEAQHRYNHGYQRLIVEI